MIIVVESTNCLSGLLTCTVQEGPDSNFPRFIRILNYNETTKKRWFIICLLIVDNSSAPCAPLPLRTVRDTIIHSIHSLFSEWILWTWQLRRLLFNINRGWPDRRAVTTPWPSAVSFNARPPAWQEKNISTTSPTEKNLMSYSPLRPASFWKLLNHFFSSCPCDILLYIVLGGGGSIFCHCY